MPPTVQTNEPEREKRPPRTGERRLVCYLQTCDAYFSYYYYTL